MVPPSGHWSVPARILSLFGHIVKHLRIGFLMTRSCLTSQLFCKTDYDEVMRDFCYTDFEVLVRPDYILSTLEHRL